MRKKIAIQFFGEIRYYDIALTYFKEYKRIAKHSNNSLDLHMVGWENEYTKELDYDIFDTTNLIESPNAGRKVDTPKKQILENREGHSKGWFNPSYSMFWGAYYRKQYQIENKINYDWVIVTRPDHVFELNDFKKFMESGHPLCQKHPIQQPWLRTRPYLIYNCRGWSELNPWGAYNGQDDYWLGTQEAIDLFCKNFNTNYLDDEGNFLVTYHNLFGHFSSKSRMYVRSDYTILDKARHKINPIKNHYKDGIWFKKKNDR